jgi:prepilin-type N-terminal cleavage/methylation domain-containing protein
MAASRSRSLRTCSPSGFTLIEILVVIAIIGMLMSLSGFAAFQALKYTKEKAIIAEIGRLSGAMETYKESRNDYPPCMQSISYTTGLTVPTNSFYQSRQNLMNAHTRAAYNNFAITLYSATAGKDFVTASVSATNTTPVYMYYTKVESTGNIVKLNFETMDAAEALVFWLGGFPCPYLNSGTPSQHPPSNGVQLVPKKLVGFSKYLQNPFTLTYSVSGALLTGDRFLETRSPPFYDFDESRLADCDNDGWPEYYPEKPDFLSSPPTAPYVYFDAALYTMWRLDVTTQSPMLPYPPPAGMKPNLAGVNQNFAPQWGMALPYAKSISGTVITWINPSSFQIIAPGMDRMYSTSVEPSMLALTRITPRKCLISNTAAIGQEETDNFTNFTDQKLGDAVDAMAASSSGS